jgi:hypothetical protein
MQELVEGRTGTLPDGTRVIVRGGQVVPIEAPGGLIRQADGSMMTPVGPRGGAPRRVGGLSTREQMSQQEARDAAALVESDLSDLEQFSRLQSQQPTGGWMALPGARQVVGAFDPDVASMNAITARLAPAQRVPGSGTTSDRDLSLFLQASPSASQPRETNNAIIDRGRQEAARRQLYAEFLDRYGRENGTLNGASEAWRQYYSPPPVAQNSPVPRGNVEPTTAQRQAVNRMNESGARNRRATLGSRQNPRVPPDGFDINTLPAGDFYISAAGQLAQVPARERQNQALRDRSRQTRTGVASIRRLD